MKKNINRDTLSSVLEKARVARQEANDTCKNYVIQSLTRCQKETPLGICNCNDIIKLTEAIIEFDERIKNIQTLIEIEKEDKGVNLEYVRTEFVLNNLECKRDLIKDRRDRLQREFDRLHKRSA